VSHTWSPDGTQLGCVFQLNDGWVFQVYPAFFGGAPQQTLSLEDADAGAKDGPKVQAVKVLRWIDRTIYLQVSQRDWSLRRVELDGATGMTNISANWKLAGSLRSVDVSPDGRKAAMVLSVAGREDLWMANIDGSSPRALTNDAFFERAPVWNGRSDRIMFQSNRGGQLDLWEIEPRSKAVAHLASGEMEMIAESSSANGSLISFQRLSHNAKLWLWGPIDAAGRQLTQDTLSDYSPAVPANGRSLAFQRSQPVPSRGYTIIDAKLFVAPFDGRATVGNAQPVADGFAPAFSADGNWIAYLQRTEGSLLMTLLVRNLSSGATFPVSKTTALPLLTLVPVDWASTTIAWSSLESDSHLYFVDQPDVAAIRRYRAGSASADAPMIRSQSATEFFRDLYVSPDKRRLMYVSASKGVVNVNILDLPDLPGGTNRQIATFKSLMGDVFGRGWLDGNLVLVRRVQAHENFVSDVEILVVNSVSGQVSRAGAINAAFMGTARLHAAKRALYITRIENGVHNVFEFAIDTGALKALTRNTLPGVTFSGFHPVGSSALVGTREERRQDIWLIQETGTKRPGNPAGR
jgi:Tol biopolymer transport system component